MPGVVVVAVIAGLAVYAVVCGAVLIVVTTPASLIAVAVGLLAGTAVGVQRTLVVLAGRYPGTVVGTPRRVAAGQLPGRVRPEHVRRDRAWPQYFALQA